MYYDCNYFIKMNLLNVSLFINNKFIYMYSIFLVYGVFFVQLILFFCGNNFVFFIQGYICIFGIWVLFGEVCKYIFFILISLYYMDFMCIDII